MVDSGGSDASLEARSGRIVLLFGIALIGVSGVLHVERALFWTGDRGGSALAAVEIEDTIFTPPAPPGGSAAAFARPRLSSSGYRAPVLAPARRPGTSPALAGIVPSPALPPPAGAITAPPAGSNFVALPDASGLAPAAGNGGTQLASLEPVGFGPSGGGGSIGGLPGTSTGGTTSGGTTSTGGTTTGGDTSTSSGTTTGGTTTGGTTTGGDTSTGGTTTGGTTTGGTSTGGDTSTGGTTTGGTTTGGTSTGGDTSTSSGTTTGGTTTGGTTTGGTTTGGDTSTGGTTTSSGGSSGGITPPPVPEPGIWALMILGFGVIGHALRRTRGVSAASANRHRA